MGTLGDAGKFNGLLCPHWHAAHLGRVETDLLLRRAAGIRGEGLGAETAVWLHSGQQVKLWLSSLQTGESNSQQPNKNNDVINSDRKYQPYIHKEEQMFSLSDPSPGCF